MENLDAIKFNTVDEAVSDLKSGKIIIVCDDEFRENEGDFVALAEHITPEMVNFMITHGRGVICIPLDKSYAKRLKLNLMVQNSTDYFDTPFTVSIDHVSNSTGVSVLDRTNTIKSLLDEKSVASDFCRPGHSFPLLAKENGVLERAGHTEATVDLAKLCGAKPVGVICEILNPNGTMARTLQLAKIAKQFDLKMITIKDLIHYRKIHDKLVKREVEVELPTRFGNFNMIGYSNFLDNMEHVALVKGQLTLDRIPLVRLHSECLTGDVFYSYRCDCGEQLDLALNHIEEDGYGVVIYLRQEGRGIGLLNKLRAYKLQQEGYDTIDANRKLGFGDDLREYYVAAQILKDLGVKKIRLITNNPEKIKALEACGIEIFERVSSITSIYSENAQYLETKVTRFGHLLPIEVK